MASSNPMRKSMRMTPLGRVRLASPEDAPHIMELVNESMSKIFRVHGTPQIVYCIENCVLSICQLDIDEIIVGFLSLRDYPPIPAVHPQAWEEYIWTKYKAIELNSRNTLFIHLLCWHSMYTREVIDSMLRSVFMHDPYLQHIAMVKPLVGHPLLMPGQSRAESSFRRLNTMEKGMSVEQLPPLLVADRKEVCPRLRIRRAVEEDNDDIVPILEAHSSRIRELYGDYYISELVARHPESERVLLVCEHKEVAVGIMCLNTAINFEALEESYELSPFCGLRKLDAEPRKSCPNRDIDASQVSMSSACGDNGLAFMADTLARRKERDKTRVTWIFDEDEFREFAVAPPYAPVSTPSQLDVLNLLEEDEDEEMEFDIVNIDTDLLRVPQLLSYDSLVQGPVETMKKMMEGTLHKEDIDELCKRKQKGSVSAISVCHKFPEPLRYSGTSNVFLIELFAMHHEYDERYGFDMLEVAFELFPDRDYCMMCLPSNNTSFPLLEHFTLVTPYSNRMRFINETLYVTHVNSVRGKMRVRPGEAYDMSSMFDVCEHAPIAQTLLDLFDSALGSSSLECYVMLSEKQPVGMIVLGPMEDGTTVRTQYDLEPEPRRPGTDGMVLTGVVSPVFEPHYRWFLRELLRHSKYSTLFWLSRPFARGDDNPLKHLTSVAGHMTPVHPRRPVPNISGNKDLDKIYKDISVPFALWVLERPLTSLPKVYVNSSIVVVGASRTGLSFLETLLLGPTCQYLTFSNVTLISEHGLPTVNECLKAAATCVPRDGRYSDRYLKSVPFYFYLDVMSAVMVGIDRKKKCIHLKGGGVKFYDELILTCGQQFQHPDYLHGPLQLVKEVELGKPCERILMDDPKYHPDRVPEASELPDNVFLINSLYEANIILRKLMHMITESSKETTCHEPISVNNPVIVYGDFIEAYSCIAALLELGIMADMINFVEPFPPDDPAKLRVNCFNDEKIDHRVQGSLEDLGIRVYRGYYLTGWQHNDRHVESINLMSHLHYTTQTCFALFYYGFKAIDVHAFNAINECGLVYDGGLVVDAGFASNDASVYGAGPCVKYSRKLYATQHAHTHYCSEDVGEALAKLFLKKMDPFVKGSDEENDLMPRYSSTILNFSYKESHASIGSDAVLAAYANKMPEGWSPVMKFESPIMISATLPGPLYYLKVRKPGPEIPMEVKLSLPHQGHTLTTDKDNNYFRLQLNVLHCVSAVTCLSHEQFSTEILTQLYGKHEAFFHKLLSRYEMGLVPDLFEYFLQPWVSAVYQETFSDLLRGINEQDVGTVYDLVYSKFKSFEDVVSMEEAKLKSISRLICNENCGFGRQVSLHRESLSFQLGTFRSVLDKFVARKSLHDVIASKKPADIPSECGQSEAVRTEAAAFWKQIGGEQVVGAHLAGYLNKTSVINSHYAVPDPALIPNIDIS